MYNYKIIPIHKLTLKRNIQTMLNYKANVKLMDDADYPLAFGRQHFNSKTLSPYKKNFIGWKELPIDYLYDKYII